MNILKLSLFDFFEQFALILRPEGVVALQHDKIQDAQRPHISIHGAMVLLGYDFGRHVSGRSTKCVNGLAFGTAQAEAKIDKLQLPISINQYILSLDIAMDDIPGVQVL